MNLLQFLNHQAGGNQRFHIDKRADGWRIKPRSFAQYLDNDNVIETLQGVDGIECKTRKMFIMAIIGRGSSNSKNHN
jgi:hypothetical protein